MIYLKHSGAPRAPVAVRIRARVYALILPSPSAPDSFWRTVSRGVRLPADRNPPVLFVLLSFRMLSRAYVSRVLDAARTRMGWMIAWVLCTSRERRPKRGGLGAEKPSTVEPLDRSSCFTRFKRNSVSLSIRPLRTAGFRLLNREISEHY